MFIVRFCQTVWSQPEEFVFKDGVTLAEVVDFLHVNTIVPQEFESHGACYLEQGDKGCIVERANWHLVRPKPNVGVFISTIPKGGGKQGGKNTFALIAAIALIAVVAFVSAGGIGFLAPSLMALVGPQTIGASIAAAVVGAAGGALIGMLTQPNVGNTGGSSSSLGSAGIQQNTLSAFAQVPAVRGKMLVTPPLLARPYTETVGNDQYIHAVCGITGPCLIENIKINGIPIEAYSSTQLTYEVRQGFADDTPLTLVTKCGFEEGPNESLPKHAVRSDDGSSDSDLVPNSTTSYPRPLLYRTCRDCDDFRILLSFPGGLYQTTDTSFASTGLRIRMRAIGSPTWINLPSLVLKSNSKSGFRVALWFHWDYTSMTSGFSSNLILQPIAHANSMGGDEGSFQCDPWWDPSSGSGSRIADNCWNDDYEMHFYMDKDATMPKGQYIFEITKGYVSPDGNTALNNPFTDDDGNDYGFYSYFDLSGSQRQIKPVGKVTGEAVVQSYTSFRNVYPINETGLAMIAVKAKNMAVQSISAEFTSIVPVWNGSIWDEDNPEPSSSPPALLRDVMFNSDNNELPLDPGLLDTLDDWFDYCVAEDYTCDTFVQNGSVEKVANLIAQSGNAALRRNGKWGVIIDRDLSAEGVVQFFNSMNMLSPLTISIGYKELPNLTRATFLDRTNDYQQTEILVPDDGYTELTYTLSEATSMDGIVEEAKVQRAVLMTMRRTRLRRTKYTFDTKRIWLRAQKGDLVGVMHPVLKEFLADGRVRSWTTSGGDLATVTLDTEAIGLEPLPANFFDAINVFNLTNAIGPEIAGITIELPTGAVVTYPITAVSGKTFTIATGNAIPAGFKQGLVASVGTYLQEYRRLIIAGISPRENLGATITLIDEAPGIHEGF